MWRGLVVDPEDRCSPYDPDDYPYSQSVERRIVAGMGGIGRSLEVVERAVSLGMGVIVGAQVGEASILTRAGLTVMQAARPALVASEGAFGTHLLREDLTAGSLMFGGGGVLTLPDVSAPGLGLAVREGMLEAM